MGNPGTGCRCGSGGHPRRCAVHPFTFDAHVAEINFEDALYDDRADGAIDEHIADLRRLYEAYQKANRANLKHRCEQENKAADRIEALEKERDEALADLAELVEAHVVCDHIDCSGNDEPAMWLDCQKESRFYCDKHRTEGAEELPAAPILRRLAARKEPNP